MPPIWHWAWDQSANCLTDSSISTCKFCGFLGEESSHSSPVYPQHLLFAFCILRVHLVADLYYWFHLGVKGSLTTNTSKTTKKTNSPCSIDIEAVDVEGQKCNDVREDAESHGQTQTSWQTNVPQDHLDEWGHQVNVAWWTLQCQDFSETSSPLTLSKASFSLCPISPPCSNTAPEIIATKPLENSFGWPFSA